MTMLSTTTVKQEGKEVVLVSSGAIATGAGKLGMEKKPFGSYLTDQELAETNTEKAIMADDKALPPGENQDLGAPDETLEAEFHAEAYGAVAALARKREQKSTAKRSSPFSGSRATPSR